MKKILLLAIVSIFIFSSSIFAIVDDNNSQTMNSNVSKFNLGVQLKFMSGLGFSGDYALNEKVFLTGSASWLFSIIDISVGSGYRATRLFDLIGKLNLISVSSGSNEGLLIFPEILARLKVSNLLFVDAGFIIPFTSDNRKILSDYLNVPFIVNVGVVFYFITSQ